MHSERRIQAFEKELDSYKEKLFINKHLAITGLTEVGTRTMVKLLSEKVSDEFELNLYDDNFIDFDDILGEIKDVKGKILITIPAYSARDSDFQINLQKLLQGTKKNIYTIIGINTKDYLNLENLFAVSIKPICGLEILKVRSKSELFELLQEYCDINTAEQYINEIHELSGGIPGLMKRIILMFLSKRDLSIEGLISDHSTRIVLDKLSKEFNNLSNKEQKDFGLINSRGEVISTLLKAYLDNSPKEKETLADRLYKLFLENKGEIISIDKIDDFIAENGEFSLWNRYKLIERVRDLVGSEYKLVTIRNKGYKLVNVQT